MKYQSFVAECLAWIQKFTTLKMVMPYLGCCLFSLELLLKIPSKRTKTFVAFSPRLNLKMKVGMVILQAQNLVINLRVSRVDVHLLLI